MKNNTKLRIPKKYQHMIEEVHQDVDGYWVYLNKGFYVQGFDHGCQIHEDTQKDILALLPYLKPCDQGKDCVCWK